MRWWAVLCAGVIVGCAPSEAPEIGQLRQAFPGAPVFTGDQGALLGSSLAVCPGGGFVVGAPGTGTALLSTNGSILPAVGFGLGRSVACVGNNGNRLVLAGSDAGVWSANESASAWAPAFASGSVVSMSRSDAPLLPLLVGSGSSVKFYDPAGGTAIGTPILGTSGLGAVVQWFPDGEPRFAVTKALGANVQLYDFNAATAASAPGPNLQETVAGFGKALAVGDLFATPGLEIAVGANGAVYIFSETGALLTRLTGISSSFGSSLTIQRHVAPDLDALVAGEPSLDLVQRFIGDAGGVFSSVVAGNSEQFGASVAIDELNVLAIGAPGRGIGGAVYFDDLPFSSRLGQKQECTVGLPCTGLTSCNLGECLGGTFCETAGTQISCSAGEVCRMGQCTSADAGTNVDAGRPIDAGVLPIDDGGVVIDAGIIPSVDAGITPFIDAGVDAGADAGAQDAGFDGGKPELNKDAGSGSAADAGVMSFTTSGCSGVPGLPIGLLGLILLRRRR